MESLLDAAYTRKKVFIFYSYQPEWIHAAYDLRQVEEPPFDGFASESFKDDPRYNPEGCYLFRPGERGSRLVRKEQHHLREGDHRRLRRLLGQPG